MALLLPRLLNQKTACNSPCAGYSLHGTGSLKNQRAKTWAPVEFEQLGKDCYDGCCGGQTSANEGG